MLGKEQGQHIEQKDRQTNGTHIDTQRPTHNHIKMRGMVNASHPPQIQVALQFDG